MTQKNYGFIQALLVAMGPWVFVTLAIGIPLLIFGTAAAIKFIQVMNTPILNGAIPIWSLIVVGIGLMLVLRR